MIKHIGNKTSGIFPAIICVISLLIFIIFFLFSLPAFSQEKVQFDNLLSRQDSLKILYSKYVASKGDPETKIKELLVLMDADVKQGDIPGALRKIQIALVLEDQVTLPSVITFELNVYIGKLISGINKGYALEYYEKATEIAKVAKDIPPSRLFHMFTNRAGCHQFLMENDSARFYYYKAIRAAMLDNIVSVSSTYNNLGYFYNAIQQYDSAGFYFYKALTLLGDKDNHLSLYTAIIDNIAQLDIRDGNYHKAIRTFQFNDSAYLALGYTQQYIINKVRLMQSMVEVEMSGVHQQINQTRHYIEEQGSSIDERVVLSFYEFANDYYFDHGLRNDQLFYRKEIKRLSHKIEKRNIDQLDELGKVLLEIQELSLRSDIEAYQLRDEKQRLEIRNTRLTAVAGVVALFLIILLLMVYMRQRRHEHQIEKRIAEDELRHKELEAKLIRQELELKKHDLTNVVLHNTQVYDANQKIIERLRQIREEKTNADDKIRALLIDLQQQNQISERSIGLQSKIDDVNTEFYEKLKTRYPGMTKSEAELCGYIRINLSTKDISILKNVEAASVKMGKNRLRKKLGLTPEDDLYRFVSEI